MGWWKKFNEFINRPEPMEETSFEDSQSITDSIEPEYDWGKRRSEVRIEILKRLRKEIKEIPYDVSADINYREDGTVIIHWGNGVFVFDNSFVGELSYTNGMKSEIIENYKNYMVTEDSYYEYSYYMSLYKEPFYIYTMPGIKWGYPDKLKYENNFYTLPIGSAKKIYEHLIKEL